MQDTLQTARGEDLVNLRRSSGVLQVEVARRLGVGRVSLHRWERSESVDAIRAERYRRAVAQIVEEAVAL